MRLLNIWRDILQTRYEFFMLNRAFLHNKGIFTDSSKTIPWPILTEACSSLIFLLDVTFTFCVVLLRSRKINRNSIMKSVANIVFLNNKGVTFSTFILLFHVSFTHSFWKTPKINSWGMKFFRQITCKLMEKTFHS